MINFNGDLVKEDNVLSVLNRSFLYGDGVFETLKVVNNKILFLEEHYFRLMASMRIVRMKIPLSFTMEFFENEILSLVNSNNVQFSSRVRFTVYRNDGGLYNPISNEVSYVITAESLENQEYKIDSTSFEVDLYKDAFISAQLLSTIKSTSKIINVTASIFAKENRLDSCLLLNNDKNVVEAVAGNIFMYKDNQLLTPPLNDGCLNGIMRKQILIIAKELNIDVVEVSISPFDLQKADELFITNIIKGIQPITKYRKKEFKSDLSSKFVELLNAKIKIN